MIDVKRHNSFLRKRNAERILKLVGGDEAIAAKVMPPILTPPQLCYISRSNELTVCITNFKRANFLNRAIRSCRDAGVSKVIVDSMEPDGSVRSIIQEWQSAYPGWLEWRYLDVDLGCHELWVRAAYAAKTDRVLILHDDDALAPEFGQVLKDVIHPALDNGYVVTWRGAHLWEDGRVTPCDYWRDRTENLSAKDLEAFLLQPGFSLSPIVSVFHRQTLIHALKEGENCIHDPDIYLRPGMLLSTETLAHLRHTQGKHGWKFVDKVLSHYGMHDGSGTCQMEQSGKSKRLIDGYNLARQYFRAHREPPRTYEPRLIVVYFDVPPVDDDERRRFQSAYETWQWHFRHGQMMEFPVRQEDLRRSSADIQDPRPVPYVKDLFDHGCNFAMPEDIVVYVNRDIGLTTLAPERIIESVRRNNGATVAFRRNVSPPHRHYKTLRNFRPDGGFDLMAFTPAWWAKNRSKMPDMFIGREAWDTCFRRLVEEHVKGSLVSGSRGDFWNEPCYLDDVIWHEAHQSYWIRERKTNPSQLHNRKLALEFFSLRKDKELVDLLTP